MVNTRRWGATGAGWAQRESPLKGRLSGTLSMPAVPQSLLKSMFPCSKKKQGLPIVIFPVGSANLPSWNVLR